MTTATFSNGYKDTYKGKRAVKAAWMIELKESGKVLDSGHSMTTQAASKTAESKLKYLGLGHFFDIPKNNACTTAKEYAMKQAKEFAGITGTWPQVSHKLRKHNSEQLRKVRDSINIEIVEL